MWTCVVDTSQESCPIGIPSIWLWVMEMADRIVFIVRYSRPSLNSLVKNSKKSWTAHEMGSIFRWEHHLSHLLQARLYVVFVPLLHSAANSWEALLEIPSACYLCLIVSRQLGGAVLLLSEDVVFLSTALGTPGRIKGNLLTVLVVLATTVVTSKLVLLGSEKPCPPWSSRHTCLSGRKVERHNLSICSKETGEHQSLLHWDLLSSSWTISTKYWGGLWTNLCWTCWELSGFVGMLVGVAAIPL